MQLQESLLRAKLAGRLEERERIARELHDTVMQSAHGLILQFQKELLDTIRATHLGMKRVHSDVSARLAGHVGDERLSDREVQVLDLVAGGHSNKRVAAALSISEQTVKGHVKSILGKLGANDRTHAVTLGLTRGFIQL